MTFILLHDINPGSYKCVTKVGILLLRRTFKSKYFKDHLLNGVLNT